MILKSIRGRLLAWLALLLICILTGFGLTVFELQRKNRLNQIDDELRSRVAALSEDMRPAAKESSSEQTEVNLVERKIILSPRVARLFNETDTNDFYFAFWSAESDLLRRSKNAPTRLSSPAHPGSDSLIHFRTFAARREAFHFNDLGECVLVGRSVAAESATLRHFGFWLALIGAGVLALGLGGVRWFVNRAIRPIETISATARRIADGNLSERIKLRDTESELGQLAAVLNSTFARLETAFTQQKNFTADASHELRTPISVLISETQTALARERSPEEYRETIEACLETGQQMRKLMESLLELARFDAGQEKLPHGHFNLADRAREAIDLVQPLADARGIQIVSSLPDAVIAGDADRISQVIINLLTNAIRYNTDNGTIGVTIHPDESDVELTVSDTGRGIAPEELPHVFERFYRPDKARSGETGGTGLGLSICKAIVEAHGGAILVSSKPGLGSLFMVQLPTDPWIPPHHEYQSTQKIDFKI